MLLVTAIALGTSTEVVSFPGCVAVRWEPSTKTALCVDLEFHGLDTELVVRSWSSQQGLDAHVDSFVNLDPRGAIATLATFRWAPTPDLIVQNERFQLGARGAEQLAEVSAAAEGPLARDQPAHLEGAGCSAAHRMDAEAVDSYEVVCPDETYRVPASGGACQLESEVFLLNREGILLQHGGPQRRLADVPHLRSLSLCTEVEDHWLAIGAGHAPTPSVHVVDLDSGRSWSARGGLGGRLDGVDGFFVGQRRGTVFYELDENRRSRVVRRIRRERGTTVIGAWRDGDALCWATRPLEGEHVTRILCGKPAWARR